MFNLVSKLVSRTEEDFFIFMNGRNQYFFITSIYISYFCYKEDSKQRFLLKKACLNMLQQSYLNLKPFVICRVGVKSDGNAFSFASNF